VVFGKKIISLSGAKLPRVKIAVPFYDSLPVKMVELIEQIIMGGIPGYRAAVIRKESTIIQFARNELVDEPPSLEYDYLFFIDDDMGYDEERFRSQVDVDVNGKTYKVPYVISLIKRIVDHDLDICAGYYTQRCAPHMPLVYKKLYPGTNDGPWVHVLDPPADGVHEIDAVATGFLCIKRRVIDAFKEEFKKREAILRRFQEWCGTDGKAAAFKRLDIPLEVIQYLHICKPDLHPPFWVDTLWDPSQNKWVNVGEDIYFCREAQRLGFKIHCDFGVGLGHETRKWITPEQYVHAYKEQTIKSHLEWCEKKGIKSPVINTEPQPEKVAVNG
jgi:glycosyltransferase involved in cell wall biosynthesis